MTTRSRLLVAAAQSGLFATFYILMREISAPLIPWNVAIDGFACIFSCAIIFFRWLTVRSIDRVPSQANFTSQIICLAMMVLFIIGEAIDWIGDHTGKPLEPGSFPLLMLELLTHLFMLGIRIVTVSIAAACSGMLAAVLYRLVTSSAHAARAIATVVVVLSFVVPAGATLNRAASGCGAIDLIIKTGCCGRCR